MCFFSPMAAMPFGLFFLDHQVFYGLGCVGKSGGGRKEEEEEAKCRISPLLSPSP